MNGAAVPGAPGVKVLVSSVPPSTLDILEVRQKPILMT